MDAGQPRVGCVDSLWWRRHAEPAATPSDSVVGATGGTVTEASGAQVTVPAGAIRTPTTLRIAQDSTGAPALPAEVRIPLPGVALRPNQAFMLAMADPAG